MKSLCIQGAIFDMDGTLVDSLHFWSSFWKDIGITYFNDSNYRPPEEVDKAIRTMLFTQAVKHICQACHLPATEQEIYDYALENLAQFYQTKVRAKEGAFALLDELKRQNIRICLASATEMAYIRIALDALGLTPYFDCVLSCAEIGKGKDRPDIYLLAAQKLDALPHQLCVFEDSYVALETARAAGFQTVGIYDRCNYEQARLEAASDIYLAEGHTMAELIGSVTK